MALKGEIFESEKQVTAVVIYHPGRDVILIAADISSLWLAIQLGWIIIGDL